MAVDLYHTTCSTVKRRLRAYLLALQGTPDCIEITACQRGPCKEEVMDDPHVIIARNAVPRARWKVASQLQLLPRMESRSTDPECRIHETWSTFVKWVSAAETTLLSCYHTRRRELETLRQAPFCSERIDDPSSRPYMRLLEPLEKLDDLVSLSYL